MTTTPSVPGVEMVPENPRALVVTLSMRAVADHRSTLGRAAEYLRCGDVELAAEQIAQAAGQAARWVTEAG